MSAGLTLIHKLIDAKRTSGGDPGDEVSVRVDQVMIHDASGPMVAMELEAMGLDRIRVGLAVGYVDHLLLQETHRSAEDHLFFRSACQRYGLWYSRAGNGICHPLHQAYFGKPGEVLIGADSHTTGLGAIAMLAIGAGGIDVALTLAGEPFSFPTPKIFGVRLIRALPDWVSAKDVILEMLRRHGVAGGKGCIVEYFGPGVASLSVMDRHVITSMGAELGATTSIFPSDDVTRDYLARQDREGDWLAIGADADAVYDKIDEIDLSQLEPLIALPSSPANVVTVREAAGTPVYQSYIGSSANPGFRDFAVVARMVDGLQVAASTSLDINPSSATVLRDLTSEGDLAKLIAAGARLHQAGCNGCIGLGQAPASGKASLRTVPRNFPGRSGTPDDQVYLCSPETAAASALTGVITDPRSSGGDYPRVTEPARPTLAPQMFTPPLAPGKAAGVALVRSSSMSTLPKLESLADAFEVPVLLKAGDDISTDEILPAGHSMTRWTDLTYLRSLCFQRVDPTYVERAANATGGHVVVAGRNYGQGSSREHAALTPRWLGLRVVFAKDIARIHFANLINAGILPLTFSNADDYAYLAEGDSIRFEGLRAALALEGSMKVTNMTKGKAISFSYGLSDRQREVLLAGGAIEWMSERLAARKETKRDGVVFPPDLTGNGPFR